MNFIRVSIQSSFTLFIVFIATLGCCAQDKTLLTSPPLRVRSATVAPQDALVFKKCFDSLAKQTKMTIIAEAQPLNGILDIKQAAQYTNRSLPATEAVNTFAALYDYRVTWKNHIILLEKKYSSPLDLPGVTVEEYRDAVHDINLILGRYNPKLKPERFSDRGSQMDKFIRSLSSEQIQEMGKKTLRVSGLNSGQRDFFQSVTRYVYVQFKETDVLNLESKLKRAASTEAILQKKGTGSQAALEIESPSLLPMEQPVVPLQVSDAQIPEQLRGLATDYQYASTLSSAPTSLNDIAEIVNRTSGGKLSLIIDDPLKDKPLSVFGINYSPPSEMLYGIASIYGLKVVGKGKAFKIIRPSRRYVENEGAIANEVQHVLPAPLVRILQSRLYQSKIKDKIGTADELKTEYELHELKRVLPFVSAKSAYQKLQGDFLRMDKQKIGKMPMNSLTSEDNICVANILIWKNASVLSNLISVPEYIADFDNTLVVGGFSESNGKRYFTLGVETSRPGLFRGKPRTQPWAALSGEFNP